MDIFRLQSDVDCEVLVLGASITGALCAHHLIKEGMDVMFPNARDAFSPSDSAGTASPTASSPPKLCGMPFGAKKLTPTPGFSDLNDEDAIEHRSMDDCVNTSWGSR